MPPAELLMGSKQSALTLMSKVCAALAVAGVVLATVSSAAQTAPGAAVAEPAEDLTCQAKNYAAYGVQAQAPYWPAPVAALVLDGACWISAEQLASSMEGGSKPTLIDVRPRSVQKAAPLAHALQLELAEVASKRFLQQEPVVLVGTGLDYANLSDACQQLKKQGFAKVQAVRGGARSWAAAANGSNAASQGNSASSAGNAMLQPLEANEWIASLGQGLQWTVISASTAMQKASKDHIPVSAGQLVSVQVDGNGGKEHDAKLVAAVTRAYLDKVKRYKNTAQAQALIVITDEAVSDTVRLQVEQALAKAVTSQGNAITTLPAYWLQGGWQGYEQQVAQTAAIQQTASHRLQVPCGRI